MREPRLSRRLTLETRVSSPDGGGGYAESWAALGAHWAEIEAPRGAEVSGPGAPESRLRARAVVRWAPEGAPARPKAGQRFREGGRVWDVLAVAERDPERRFLTCWIEERTRP